MKKHSVCAALALAASACLPRVPPPPPRPRLSRSMVAAALRRPVVLTPLVAMVGAQVAMVSVMTLTPLQLDHHGHGLGVIGMILSAHMIGMFALAPLSGRIADRFGGRATIFLGILAVGVFGLGFWEAVLALLIGNVLGALSHGVLSARGPVVATFHPAMTRSRALSAAQGLLQLVVEKITARIAVPAGSPGSAVASSTTARRISADTDSGVCSTPWKTSGNSVPMCRLTDRMVRSTSLWVHATSLGGVESTFERRRRWKSEPATIPDGLVRLSVGIEDVEDLWADLEGALNRL